MKILFWGTPDFALSAVRALDDEGFDIVGVVTQPDRPAGRGRRLTPSPVKEWAIGEGYPVLTPERPRGEEFLAEIRALDPDISIVVAYGHILKPEVLELPPMGSFNLHASLLPELRGAAPINRAIMAGDAVTGVQVMQMEAGLDTGPVLLSETVPITATDTAASLSEKLSHIGADMLPRVLAALDRGGIVPQIQPEEGVTYAHKITPEEARIDWSKPAIDIDAHIRGLTPVPGAWTLLSRDGEDVRLKIWEAAPDEGQGAPGTVLGSEAEGIKIAAGDGTALLVTKLQRPGKAAQDADTFLRGYPLAPGESLS